MSMPEWLLQIVAGVALLAAALSAGHLVAVRAWTRPAIDADIALSHVLMGIALAGALVAGLRTLPNTAWAVVFAVMTAWFDWRLWQESRERGAAAAIRGPYAPHLVYSAALLYLFIALPRPSPAGSGMAGMSGMTGMSSSMPGMVGGSSGAMGTLSAPTLAFAFTVLLIAFTVRDLDRPAIADGRAPASGLVKGGRVALGVTTAFILIIMI
jgi:hypothetical protein